MSDWHSPIRLAERYLGLRLVTLVRRLPPDGGGADVFVHVAKCLAPMDELRQGQRFQYIWSPVNGGLANSKRLPFSYCNDEG